MVIAFLFVPVGVCVGGGGGGWRGSGVDKGPSITSTSVAMLKRPLQVTLVLSPHRLAVCFFFFFLIFLPFDQKINLKRTLLVSVEFNEVPIRYKIFKTAQTNVLLR